LSADGLNAVKGLHVDMEIVETNIVSPFIYLDIELTLLLIFFYLEACKNLDLKQTVVRFKPKFFFQLLISRD